MSRLFWTFRYSCCKIQKQLGIIPFLPSGHLPYSNSFTLPPAVCGKSRNKKTRMLLKVLMCVKLNEDLCHSQINNRANAHSVKWKNERNKNDFRRIAFDLFVRSTNVIFVGRKSSPLCWASMHVAFAKLFESIIFTVPRPWYLRGCNIVSGECYCQSGGDSKSIRSAISRSSHARFATVYPILIFHPAQDDHRIHKSNVQMLSSMLSDVVYFCSCTLAGRERNGWKQKRRATFCVWMSFNCCSLFENALYEK